MGGRYAVTLTREVARRGLEQLTRNRPGHEVRQVRMARSANPDRVSNRSRENLGEELVDAALEGRIATTSQEFRDLTTFVGSAKGRRSAVARQLATEAEILASYLAGQPGSFANVQNFLHVRQLVTNGKAHGAAVGLSAPGQASLRGSFDMSDHGKNFSLVHGEGGGALLGSLFPFGRIMDPSQVTRKVLSDSEPALAALVDYLRLGQLSKGGPLQFVSPEKGTGTEGLKALIDIWGRDPFAMERDFGSRPTKAEVGHAFRFARVALGPEAPYFPTKFYFHDVPGFVQAHMAGFSPAVLVGIAFHNGPGVARTAAEFGKWETYAVALSNPFWAANTFYDAKMFRHWEGGYPNPAFNLRRLTPEEQKVVVLSWAGDREAQMAVQRLGGEAVGGPVKIFVDEMWQGFGKKRPLWALKHSLTNVPQTSLNQIHAAFFEARGLSVIDPLMAAYRTMVDRGQATMGLWGRVNEVESEALSRSTFSGQEGYAVVFNDGPRLTFDPPMAGAGEVYSSVQAGEVGMQLASEFVKFL